MARTPFALLSLVCSALVGTLPALAQEKPSTGVDVAFGDPTGIAGGAGGRFGSRFGGRAALERRASKEASKALRASLAWLAEHQSPDGSWSADGLVAQSGATFAGDVRATALALLAFMGDGHTRSTGKFRGTAGLAVEWLKAAQDFETGRFGTDSESDSITTHALATQALCEAYYYSLSPPLRSASRRAVDRLLAARNRDGGWADGPGASAPGAGPSEVVSTCWALLALTVAEEAAIPIEKTVFDEGVAFLESRTNANGEVEGEDAAATAAAVFTRIFRGQSPVDHPEFVAVSERLANEARDETTQALQSDAVHRYFGTYALFQVGAVEPVHFEDWDRIVNLQVLPTQETEGEARGSWGPVGRGTLGGGRVEATALNALCLEVTFRYSVLVRPR